jgi:hypothetical protein
MTYWDNSAVTDAEISPAFVGENPTQHPQKLQRRSRPRIDTKLWKPTNRFSPSHCHPTIIPSIRIMKFSRESHQSQSLGNPLIPRKNGRFSESNQYFWESCSFPKQEVLMQRPLTHVHPRNGCCWVQVESRRKGRMEMWGWHHPIRKENVCCWTSSLGEWAVNTFAVFGVFWFRKWATLSDILSGLRKADIRRGLRVIKLENQLQSNEKIWTVTLKR